MAKEPSTSKMQPLAEGLPGFTVDLLRALDQQISAPQIEPRKLADEDYRLQLASESGKREIVDFLLSIQRRQEQEHEHGL